MPNPGWYPDPGGVPGRLRYWDGRQWTAEIRTESGPAGVGRRVLLLGAVAVAVVVLVALAVVVVRSRTAIRDPHPPTSTISGWNDSSPTASADPTRSTGPTAEPNPTTCGTADPARRRHYPADGRRHGGGISFLQPATGWADGDAMSRYLAPWAYDVSGVQQAIRPEWILVMMVGEIPTGKSFRTPEQAAHAIVKCVTAPPFYADIKAQQQVFDRPVRLDGASGWSLRVRLQITDPDAGGLDDLIDVVVLDTGADGRLAFFFGDVPPRDQARVSLLDRTIAGIGVD